MTSDCVKEVYRNFFAQSQAELVAHFLGSIVAILVPTCPHGPLIKKAPNPFSQRMSGKR